MARLIVDESAAPEELRAGLAALEAEFPDRFGEGPTVSFEKLPGGAEASLSAAANKSGVTVRYKRPCDAFRALGRLLGADGLDVRVVNYDRVATPSAVK